MRKLISTGSPLEAAAGYSRAVVQGDWCFVAGTTGYNYETMIMPRSVEEQTRNALSTIEKVLADGARTADLMGEEGGSPISTTEMGDASLAALDESL